MPGFVEALESEAGRVLVSAPETEVVRQDVVGVPGLVGVLGFVRPTRRSLRDVIDVPGPSRKN